MVKTDLELLEENRNEARAMSLAMDAQINMTQGKIILLVKPGEEKVRAAGEVALAALKKEKERHDKIVVELDRMIEAEEKNADKRVHTGNRPNV